MQKLLAILAAVGITLAGGMVGPSLVAADASSEQTITSCTTISDPGRYTLGANVTNTSGGSCLQIESGDVVLDGAGHTLAGGGTGIAIEVSANEVRAQDAYQNVTVRNVSLDSWETGLSLVNIRNATIAGVEALNTTTGVEAGDASAAKPGYPASADGTTIRDSTFTDNEDGVVVQMSENVDVIENRFEDSAVRLDLGESYAENVEVDRNELRDTDIRVDGARGYDLNISVESNDIEDGGIYVYEAPNVTIANNTVRKIDEVEPWISAIDVTFTKGASVVNNTITGSGTGIHLGTASQEALVANNDVEDGMFGIKIEDSAENTVDDNTVSNTETGVTIGQYGVGNTISGNEIHDSGEGVTIARHAENNVVAGNTLDNNVDGVHVVSIDSDGPNYVRTNDIHNNTDGVDVVGTTSTLVVESNDISGNENGVHVSSPPLCFPDGPEGAELVFVHGNDLGDNTEYGILNEDPDTLNATGNYWGATDGPSSADDPDAPFADPVTGTLANGTGTAVSESPRDPGASNVHFDSFLESSPEDAGVQNETAA